MRVDRQIIEDTLYYGMCDGTFAPLADRADDEWIELTFRTFRSVIDKLVDVLAAQESPD